MDLEEIVFKCVDWIHVAHVRVQEPAFVNTLMNLRVPHKAGYVFTSCATVSFSRTTLLRGLSYAHDVLKFVK
jgi:hypothetical protein